MVGKGGKEVAAAAMLLMVMACGVRAEAEGDISLQLMGRLYNDDNYLHLDLDPDVYKNFTEIIEGYGYPVEQHTVVTEDSYVLTVFRIPYGKEGSPGPRPAVFLQHGLLDWSFGWIVNQPIQSLAYILADNGYDVWMGNNRGTTYSRNHLKYTTKDREFWSFTYDQFARYDLPAMLSYVTQETGNSHVSYIGHSQGTTQMFAALSEEGPVASMLDLFIGLGPVTTVPNMEVELIQLLAEKRLPDALLLLGLYQFPGPSPSCLSKLFADFCAVCPGCCSNLIMAGCGRNVGAFNDTRLQVVGSHEPGETSTLNMNHWAQAVRNPTFRKYDFGPIYNREFYGSPDPPVYDLGKIPPQLPIALFWGGKDKLADPTDVATLTSQLPVPPVFDMEIPQYAHLDFIWAIDAYQVMYPQILELLATYSSS
eukprot:CAMPEP_0119120156 /NCGR_PEP_ID=MMETSP1310-20130426/1324_1 /TAXON_ID=464262 /ORGANISM="Genus nov. species nov., Strain RCC2339" /LENGTH=422 /DNA_ID=CAMNT_0007109621 /DNA_START=102 /DNA_END=1370 /DNA_ORIENTATION=-